MRKKKFLKKVQEYAELDHLDQAEDLTRVVFYLLSARLTINEGEDLRAQLSGDLKELWDGVKETKVDVIKFNKPEFLNRIIADVGLESVEEAERVVNAVFKALKSQISAGEAEDVAAQLPKGLKEMWIES